MGQFEKTASVFSEPSQICHEKQRANQETPYGDPGNCSTERVSAYTRLSEGKDNHSANDEPDEQPEIVARSKALDLHGFRKPILSPMGVMVGPVLNFQVQLRYASEASCNRVERAILPRSQQALESATTRYH